LTIRWWPTGGVDWQVNDARELRGHPSRLVNDANMGGDNPPPFGKADRGRRLTSDLALRAVTRSSVPTLLETRPCSLAADSVSTSAFVLRIVDDHGVRGGFPLRNARPAR
jgi:hypothetical protein